jgi:hypothetical protein
MARAVGRRVPQRTTIGSFEPQETMMSGFALRVPEHILTQAKAAAEEHVSINQLLVALISEGLGHRRGLLDLHGRKRNHHADGLAADIAADHLARALEAGNYILMRKPTPTGPAIWPPAPRNPHLTD